jgi:hypothetical protein
LYVPSFGSCLCNDSSAHIIHWLGYDFKLHDQNLVHNPLSFRYLLGNPYTLLVIAWKFTVIFTLCRRRDQSQKIRLFVTLFSTPRLPSGRLEFISSIFIANRNTGTVIFNLPDITHSPSPFLSCLQPRFPFSRLFSHMARLCRTLQRLHLPSLTQPLFRSDTMPSGLSSKRRPA